MKNVLKMCCFFEGSTNIFLALVKLKGSELLQKKKEQYCRIVLLPPLLLSYRSGSEEVWEEDEVASHRQLVRHLPRPVLSCKCDTYTFLRFIGAMTQTINFGAQLFTLAPL